MEQPFPETVPHQCLSDDYFKAEQGQRRQEIENFIERLESDQRNGLILTGAIWSWLATNHGALAGPGLFEQFVVFVPAVLMLFFFYRWHAMHMAIMAVAEYTRELEKKAGVPPLGWETWLAVQRRKKPLTASLAHTNRLFWFGLVLANLLLALVWLLPWWAGVLVTLLIGAGWHRWLATNLPEWSRESTG